MGYSAKAQTIIGVKVSDLFDFKQVTHIKQTYNTKLKLNDSELTLQPTMVDTVTSNSFLLKKVSDYDRVANYLWHLFGHLDIAAYVDDCCDEEVKVTINGCNFVLRFYWSDNEHFESLYFGIKLPKVATKDDIDSVYSYMMNYFVDSMGTLADKYQNLIKQYTILKESY